ncbi:MAG: MFS transporter [Desulfobacterales bacterium]|jgi:predicted MFS family arabinose efflux permease
MGSSIEKKIRVFIPFACGYFLSYLYRVVNAVLAPDLASDLGVGPAELGLLTAAYFIAFASFQLPLGVLLDRIGPRKIDSFRLIFAGAGAFVFSKAETVTGLVIGRALIGFGVSACLMAAFKAFVLWFHREQLPLINGIQMAAGGLGALTATAPVEAVLGYTDWRGVFFILSIITLAVAATVFLVVPEKIPEFREQSGGDGIKEQINGIKTVFSSLTFWRIAPLTVASQATYFAIHGLWAGPWLRDVAGLDRGSIAQILMMIAAAMVVGFVLLGAIAERLSRLGIRPLIVAVSGMIAFMIVQSLIILEVMSWLKTMWVLFGIFGTTGIIPYAVLSQSFPLHLSGRVNTGVNLQVFIAAFSAQWGIGAIINLWPIAGDGGYSPAGYQAAFATMLCLQLLSLLWFIVGSYIDHRGNESKGNYR